MNAATPVADGGVPGSCTFALAVCVNNTNIATCTPELRVRGWELRKPSASRAAHDPVAAAVRAALQSTVPGSVVGPETRDLCSSPGAVTVPLKGTPENPRAGKLVLASRATLYSGRTDTDKLTLLCWPHLP